MYITYPKTILNLSKPIQTYFETFSPSGYSNLFDINSFFFAAQRLNSYVAAQYVHRLNKEKEYLKEQQYLNAKKRVKEIKGFYSHFLIYVIVNIFISGIIIFGLTYSDNSSLSESFTNFGVYSTWLFWGIGIFFHWISVFGFKNLFGSAWEEKKIKELMRKDYERNSKILDK